MSAPNQPHQPYPPQGFPPPVAPAPAKKKSRKWPWIVGGIVAVFVIVAVAGGGDKDTSDSAAGGAPAAPAAPGAPAAPAKSGTSIAGIGTPVRDGKFEFTVTGIEAGLPSVGDNPYLMQKAQGQFVVVTMTVQNTGNEPKGISPTDQKLFDAQGRKFTADPTAAINLDSDVPLWDQINPGNSVTLKVVYDMPVGAVPASMELHDSMFSGGAKVNLQ